MTKNGAKIRSNRPKIGLKSVCVRSQQQSGRWIPKKYGPPHFFSHILGPSGRLDAPLWARLAANGGQRKPTWRPDSRKKRCQKSMPKRCRKIIEKEANLEGVRGVKMCYQCRTVVDFSVSAVSTSISISIRPQARKLVEKRSQIELNID